jgi:hypothetical protein
MGSDWWAGYDIGGHWWALQAVGECRRAGRWAQEVEVEDMALLEAASECRRLGCQYKKLGMSS